MNEYLEDRREQGFTLIELLVAIVVVGILTAVAIVGIAGLTDKGSKSACSATADAVQAAQAVYFANTGSYPTSFNDMLNATPQPDLTLSGGAKVNTVAIVGPPAYAVGQLITGQGGWTLGGTGTGTTPMVLTKSGC